MTEQTVEWVVTGDAEVDHTHDFDDPNEPDGRCRCGLAENEGEQS